MCLAIPGKIVELLPGGDCLATVDVMGVRRKIDVHLLEGEKTRPGDWVLIHVGFAMSKISEEQALDQMSMLTMLGESQVAKEEVKGYGLGEDRGEGEDDEKSRAAAGAPSGDSLPRRLT